MIPNNGYHAFFIEKLYSADFTIFEYCGVSCNGVSLQPKTNLTKKMKKLLCFMLVLGGMMTALVSCGDDNSTGSSLQFSIVTVTVTADNAISDYSTFTLSVTDKKSGKTSNYQLDNKGQYTIDLPLGLYDFAASQTVQGVKVLFGQVLNQTVSQATTDVNIKVAAATLPSQSFVLDELYFNCDKEGWTSFYYEDYLTIRNVSSEPLFADGLSIAICGDYNTLEANEEMSAYLNDNIIISQLYTIPMVNGQHVVVEPGKSLVLAHSAINHKGTDGTTGTVDLSGADFEFYVQYIENGQDYTMTTDNPEVPNMIVDYSANQAFNWGYNGATPIMLVRLDDATKAAILADKVNLTMPMSMGYSHLDYLKLPASAVVDGVETGAQGASVRKVLPAAIDQSSILVESDFGFDGQFIKRKETTNANGVTIGKDTNNSAEDFEIIAHGQKSYPKQ